MRSAERYPRLAELGVEVYPPGYVARDALWVALGDRRDLFIELFGIQTQLLVGPYAHDVEAVLERMASGRLTGTQLIPD